MKIIRSGLIAAALVLVTASTVSAADLNCQGPANVEEFRYSWRVRGGLRLLAGLMFPTSGVGNLRTTFPESADKVHSELLITAPNGRAGGFYAYESDMDVRGNRTLMTYHGYAWGEKERNERTIFDYVKRLARIRKQTPDEVENKVRPLPSDRDQVRDVLTAIYFLRQNAATLTTRPLQTSVFADGKEYPVIFRAINERRAFVMEGKRITASGFEIVDAPGGKKWPGGVRVWLSDDTRRIPFRIEIQQSIATLQLDLQSVESCSFLIARR